MAKTTTAEILEKVKTTIEGVTGINKVFKSARLDVENMPSMRYPCAAVWAGASESEFENNELEETSFSVKVICRRYKDNSGETTLEELEGLVNLVKAALKRKYSKDGDFGVVLRYTSDIQVQYYPAISSELQGKDVVFTVKHQELD